MVTKPHVEGFSQSSESKHVHAAEKRPQQPASENSAAMGSTGTARNGGGLYAAADAEMMDAEAPADLAKPVKDIEDKWKLLPRQVLLLGIFNCTGFFPENFKRLTVCILSLL